MKILISQHPGLLEGSQLSLLLPTQSLGQGSSRAHTFGAEAAIHVVFFTQAADLQM